MNQEQGGYPPRKHNYWRPFASFLRRRAKARRLQYRQIAWRSGVSAGVLKQWMSGKCRPKWSHQLMQVCKLLVIRRRTLLAIIDSDDEWIASNQSQHDGVDKGSLPN